MRRAQALLSLAALLSGSALVGGSASAQDYVGAARCGTCHEAEYKQWKQSGHATALARLSKVQQRDTSCRSCHTMAPLEDTVELSGVQCESCHGAGSHYEPRFIMRDKTLARLMGLQKIEKEVCLGCHAADAPSVEKFDYEQKLKLVVHKKDEQALRPKKATGPKLATKEKE